MANEMIELSKQKLPTIYTRKGKKCYLDPIREKLIYENFLFLVTNYINYFSLYGAIPAWVLAFA